MFDELVLGPTRPRGGKRIPLADVIALGKARKTLVVRRFDELGDRFELVADETGECVWGSKDGIRRLARAARDAGGIYRDGALVALT